MRIRLDRYILAEIIGPLSLGFLVYTFILLIRFLFQSAEMIIRRGLDASIVGQLLLLTLPNIVVLTIPMSLLFGTLIAVGRLSSDSELVAMRSSGISLLTLYRPLLVLSLCLTGLNAYLMIDVLPRGNHALQQLRLDILTQTMAQQVQPRVFFEEWPGKTVYIFGVDPTTKRWEGVFIAESSPGTGDSQITVAEAGELKVDEQGERVLLVLHQAIRHKVNLLAPDSYEMSRQEETEMVLEDQFATEQKAKIQASKGIRELTLAELRQLRETSPLPEQRNLAAVEIHKKFAIPMACTVFGLFALPLGFNNRRGGKASGFALSIGIILLYYVLLNNGEEAARLGKLPPWLAMWGANILLASLGIFLLIRKNSDRSLMISRFDRWIRQDLWAKLLVLRRLQKQNQLARRQAAEEPKAEATGPAHRAPRSPSLLLLLPRPRLRFPNLLDRYVARLFVAVFGMVTLSGLSLYILADFSETIDEILKNKIPRELVFRYYKYLSLQVFYDIAPILVLITTLITFSLLARNQEVTAAKALGVSVYRLSFTAVALALMLSLFSAYLQSAILPASNQRVAQIKDRIKGRETPRTYRRADRQWLFGQGRYIYSYLHYDSGEQNREHLPTIQRLQVFDFDAQHRMVRRLFADNARFIGDAWVFTNGWSRTLDQVDDMKVTSYTRFEEPRIVRYPEPPSYFDSEIKPPEQMRYGELKEYVSQLIGSGQSVPELQVELYNKIAFPAIALIMSLVALPFAFRLGRQGALYGIGLSVVLGIIFMAIYAFFTKMGEAGALPPLVSVWGPSAVFGVLSAYLFLGVRT